MLEDDPVYLVLLFLMVVLAVFTGTLALVLTVLVT